MSRSARAVRPHRFVSLTLLVTILFSLVPQPFASHLPSAIRPQTAEARDAGRGPEPATTGSLRYAAEVDADDDPQTNPTRAVAVPVARVGGQSALSAVRYTTILLATEVVPTNPMQNPAGTVVSFRLQNPGSGLSLHRDAIADAWGAAYVELMLPPGDLGGEFSYQASAAGFGSTPSRSFSVDPWTTHSDTQLGAARVQTTIEEDGRLSIRIETDVVIDDDPAAVQIQAVRLIAQPESPAEPQREYLPPLVAQRIDTHHARAELYLDAGEYLMIAAVQSGTIEAQSEPAFVRIRQIVAPPVAVVERTQPEGDGSMGLVQYRTPSGDIALVRRLLAGLPTTTPPAIQRMNAIEQTTRLGPFAWQSDLYTMTVKTITDDGNKRASLEGFEYDPVARRYDLNIESFLDHPVEDRLTVEVLGPHGVVIWEQTTPITLDPQQPLRHSFSVPADRGEPYGIRVTVHDPLGIEWLFARLGDGARTLFNTFRAASGSNPSGFALTVGFKGEVKVLNIELAARAYTCTVGNGCEEEVGGLNQSNWYDKVTGGLKGYFGGDFREQDFNDSLKARRMSGITLGSMAGLLSFSVRATKNLFDPAKCPNQQSLDAAKQHVTSLGQVLKEGTENITTRLKDYSEILQRIEAVPIPLPPPLTFLAVQVQPVIAFKLNGDKSGDTGVFVEIGLEAGGNGMVIPAGLALLRSIINSLVAAKDLILGVSNILRDVRQGVLLINLVVDALKQNVASEKCGPPDDDDGNGNGNGKGKGRDDPGAPNGSPDDRRDAFQNEYLPRPTGTTGQIQYIQQQIAVAQRAGLERARIYWTVQLREQELAAFDADTTRALSMTDEITNQFNNSRQRIEGLLNGSVAPAPNQTITETAWLEYTDFLDAAGETDYDRERRVLLEALDFAQRQYNGLRGQELELQHELRQMTQAKGVGVVDSGLVTWAMAAIGTTGADPVPVQIVGGVTSSGLPDSRLYSPLEAPPVLIVPSGGLYRYNGSQEVRRWLESYVSSGGTLIVLAQAEGADWELLPGGEVKGLGYFEDILCKIASVRITNQSQWINGISRDLPDIQIDGSFTAWPSTAQITLMRTTGNQKPAMIEYAFGKGEVVATSAYPDFYINGMQSQEDQIFARSLFGQAYLHGANEAVEAFSDPQGTVELTLPITNTTALVATKVTVFGDYYGSKIAESWRWAAHQSHELRASQNVALTPALQPGETRDVRISFKAPREAGLFRMATMLEDNYSWSYSGAIPGPFYQVRSPYGSSLGWRLLADRLRYPFGGTATLSAVLHNTTNKTRIYTLEPPASIGGAPQEISLTAGQTITRTYTTRVFGDQDVRFTVRENGRVVGELLRTLQQEPPTFGVQVAPAELVAGVPATLAFTATTTNIVPNTPVDWQVKHSTTVLSSPNSTLAPQDGFAQATSRASIPAAAPGEQITVRGQVRSTTIAMTQTLEVKPVAAVRSARVLKTMTIGATNRSAVETTIQGTAYGGNAAAQVLVRHGATTITSGPVVDLALSTAVQTRTLDVVLPPTLDLNKQYTLVVSATGKIQGATRRYTDQVSLPLEITVPQIALADVVRRVHEPLVARFTPMPDSVALPASGPYSVTLRGVSTTFTQSAIISSATMRGDVLELSTTVPELRQGGVYEIEVRSTRLQNWRATATWTVPPHTPVFDVPANVTAGQTLAWTVTNTGGVNTSLRGTFSLTDQNAVILARQAIDLALPVGIAATLSLVTPTEIKQGTYTVQFDGLDHLGGTVAKAALVQVQGLRVSLTTDTSKDAYLTSDTVATNNAVTTSGPLSDAWLRLQVIARKQTGASLSTLVGTLAHSDGVGRAASINTLYLGMDGQARFALLSEQFNNTIRRLDLVTGAVTTIAGGGDNSGSGSDDGVGPAARFNGIRGIAVSRDGRFAVIADAYNNTVRHIDLSTNTVTTIAGKVGERGAVDGVGGAVRFGYVEGIALSPDGTYALLADTQTIRHINLSTRKVMTIAGSAGAEGFIDGAGSQARFGYPVGVAISGDGRYALVAENNNHAIRRLDLSSGGTVATVSTLAGGSSGTIDGIGRNAQFIYPHSVAISGNGKIALVTDYYGLTVRHINVETAEVSTLAGKARGWSGSDAYGSADGTGGQARFTNPKGLALSADGKIALVADYDNHAIRRLDIADPLQPSATVKTIAGAAPDAEGARSAGRIGRPAKIALSSDGSYALVADPQTHLIRRVDVATGMITNYAGNRSENGNNTDGDRTSEAQFRAPEGLAIDAAATFALVADTGNHTIRRIDLGSGVVTTVAGTPLWSGSDDGTGANARFNEPRDIAISPDGSYALVADTGNHVIRKVMLTTGVVTTLAGTASESGSNDGIATAARFNEPMGIVMSPNGAFALVADAGNHTIRMIDMARLAISTLAGDPDINGRNDGIGADAWFQRPYDVTISADGKTALIVDTYNADIRRVDIGSRRVTTVLTSSWDVNALRFDPESIALSADGSFALVSDVWHNRIARVDLSLNDETVLREDWLAVSGSGTLARPLALDGLTADARARGQLSLEATLFSRVPGGDPREARHILARATAPFAILDGTTSISLGVAQRTYRANLSGYSADDQAASVGLSGVVRNTSGAAGPVTFSITRSDGAVIADQTISNLGAGAIQAFTASDPQPPTGPVTYTARTNLGSIANVDINVLAPSLSATVSSRPTSIALGESATLSAVVRNDGAVDGFVTVDLGAGSEEVRLQPGDSLTQTRVITPTAAGDLRQPVVFTGDIQKTDTAQVTVRDETATVTLALGGTTRDATTLVQGEDAALAIQLASPAGVTFDAAVDYQITGPTGRSGSIRRTLTGAKLSLPVPLGTLQAGAYQARVTVRHTRLGRVLATATLSFKVVAPRYDLVIDPGTAAIDNTGTARLQIVVANAATSDRAWSGSLVLDGAVTQRTTINIARGANRTVVANLALRDRAGQQVINARLLDSDGAVLMQRTITLNAAPSVAPQVELARVTTGRGSTGGEVEITATLRNDGPSGDAMLELVAFDQTIRWLAPVASGTSTATYRVAVPAGILADSYPIMVRLGANELKVDAVIEGAELEVLPHLDAQDYAPSAQATWTVDIKGTRGGPAQYDVYLRYGGQEVTRTLTIDTGQTVPVAMTFDVGPVSDRATVLVTNHPRLPTEPRFTVVIDSQQVVVREDPRAFLQTQKSEYRAGEVVRLVLHLTEPVLTAMVLAPDNIPGIVNPVLWSSLEITQPGPLLGDYPITLRLPAVMRTGRYFVKFLFDGEERALPIDVFGYDVVPQEVEVRGGTTPVPRQLAAGDILTVTTALRSEQSIAKAVITVYALSPSGNYIDLGSGATITRSLPVGLTPITLRGTLATREPGAHQVVVKVREAATGTTLGSEATFVDVGGGRLLSLTTDHGLYRPGQAGTGTLSLYGTEQVEVSVRTSGGDILLNRRVSPQGHTALTFNVPTQTERDEVLIAALRDSRGMTDTLQVAYKVAATLDTTAPQVTLLNPAPGSTLVFGSADRQVTLTGMVTETGGLREVLVNGMPATINGDRWSIQLSLGWGSNLLQIVALDRAGNVGMAPPTSLQAEPGMGARLSIQPTNGRIGDRVTATALLTSTVDMTANLTFPWASSILAEQGTASVGRLEVLDGVARWMGQVPAGEQGVSVTWTGRIIAPPNEPLAALFQAEGGLPRRSNTVALAVESQRSVYLPFIQR